MRAHIVTARGRALGAELRAWRKQAGMTGTDIARRLSWSESKVSSLETGRRQLSEVDAAMYLSCCRANSRDIKEILEFFHAKEDSWVQLHGHQLSDKMRSLIALETTASAIHTFELALIPGLLQTEDYARTLITAAGVAPPEAIEPRVRARKDRQTLLHRRRIPRCEFFIHESALRVPVGDDRIMNDQLLHLVFSSARPNIRIRVVPFAAGPHAGTGGAFTVMEYPAGGPVVNLENDVASVFLDGPAEVTHYQANLTRLAGVALDAGESRSLLAQLASEHDRPREDHDDRTHTGRPTLA